MMKLLFGTLLGFFVTSFSAQDLSSYTNIDSTESLKKSAYKNFEITLDNSKVYKQDLQMDLDVMKRVKKMDLSSYTYIDGTESLKKSTQKNFEITPIDDYFYVTNNENEKQIIALSSHHLYKFDQSGNLIDTLESSASGGMIMYNIQLENYFIYSKDGYFPNWIKTGDKTKHQYHKVYNEDLTMDLDVMKQFEKMFDDAYKKYKKGVFDEDEYVKRTDECYDYLDKRSELIKLLKTLEQQAKYFNSSEFPYYKSFMFVINNEVIKVRIPDKLVYNSEKIFCNKIRDKTRDIEEILETVIPKFPEEQKSFHFEKIEWVSEGGRLNNDEYWEGATYYDLPIGKSTLKIKVKDRYRGMQGEKAVIKINRNIFPGNKKFVLIEISGKNYYFIKEK